MFDQPPPESALHRLTHEELCIILLGGNEYEAIWSRNVFRFYFKDDSGTRSVHHAEVDEWRPAAVKL